MSEKHHAIEIHSVGEFTQFFDLSGTTPLILDFTASWCPPCQMIKPHFEQMAKDFEGKAIFLKIDVDEMKELSQQYNISCMPTFKIIKAGQVVGELEGADKDGLLNLVKQNI